MTNIIFAQPRHVYESYADLRSLIALSGFPMVYYDEIDPASDNTYILTVLNGEIPEQGYPHARARMVLWDLEYHLEGVNVPGVEVWAADKWYAEQIGARYVPMGSHVGLRTDADSTSTEAYDVAYLGYMIPRRQQIYHDLQQHGVKVSPTSAWGIERHRLLSNSKAYFHVHQHENIRTVAPLRMVVAAAYALPVISETCSDAGMFNHHFLQLAYPLLAETTPHALPHPSVQEFGERMHEALCHRFTFRKSVEAAL